MTFYKVKEGKTLTGEYVGGGRYEAGSVVELEPQYAAFYVENDVLEETDPPAEPPAPEEAAPTSAPGAPAEPEAPALAFE